ncbi:MAG: hypothetical protein WC623_24205, partial [Pedobacter sp.]|uniref:hypothetical protein n=1 Tax=Pedobacter sp. TaxID=1411316 RepID=UPI00356A80BD
MRIPTFFLTILFLLCTQFVSATDTTIGTSTTGTSTVGTQTVEPISISPLSGVAIAGVPLQFVALNKDGKKIDALFSASDGIITDTGIFTLPKAGRAMITARQGEVSAVAMVTVLPAAPHHIVVDAPDTFIYGDKYLSDGLA